MMRRKDLAEILPEVRAVIVTSLVYWPGMSGFPPEQVFMCVFLSLYLRECVYHLCVCVCVCVCVSFLCFYAGSL